MSELFRKCHNWISEIHINCMISSCISKILRVVIWCIQWITRFIYIIEIGISHFPLELLTNLFICIILNNIGICLSKITHWRSILNIYMEGLRSTLFNHIATGQFNRDNTMRWIYDWIKLESCVAFKEFDPMWESLSLKNRPYSISYRKHLLFGKVSITTLKIYRGISWRCFKF